MSDNYELTYYGNLLIEGDIGSGLESISYAYFKPKNTDTFTGNEKIDTVVEHTFTVGGTDVSSLTRKETVRPTQGKTEEVLRTKSEPIDVRDTLDPITGSPRAVTVTLTAQIQVDGSKDYSASKTKPFTAQPTQDDSGDEETAIRLEDIEQRTGGPPVPKSPTMDPGAPSEITAKIQDPDTGSVITFNQEFSDPTVDVDHERKTGDHTVVTGHQSFPDSQDQDSIRREYMVQALGRTPPTLTMTGWLDGNQLEIADKIPSSNYVKVESARFIGYAVPRKVDTTYSRVYHEKHGWIFETTFEFIGAVWSSLPFQEEPFIEETIDEAIEQASQSLSDATSEGL